MSLTGEYVQAVCGRMGCIPDHRESGALSLTELDLVGVPLLEGLCPAAPPGGTESLNV